MKKDENYLEKNRKWGLDKPKIGKNGLNCEIKDRVKLKENLNRGKERVAKEKRGKNGPKRLKKLKKEN